MTFRYYISLLIGFAFLTTVSGQVYIAEYSASNMNQFPDDNNKFEDWIELHNSSNAIVDISGYGISDKADKPQKWIFPAGTVIYPDERIILWCSGRDHIKNHNYHTNFKLSQTKGNEVLTFSDASGSIMEQHPMEITLLGHSKILDSNGNWIVNTDPKPGEADDLADTFSHYTAEPTIETEVGFYESAITVSITNNEPNSTLRFTTDGNLPTEDSPIYSGPISISNTRVVKARAYSNDDTVLPGKIDFGTYFINEDFSLPVFSIAADELQDLANGDRELRPIGSIEYFVDKELSSSSYGELNSHGQDSWINDQRSLDWVSRDEMGYSRTLNEQLFEYSDRDEYQRFMLRASGDDNYPAFNDENHEGSTHMRDEYVHKLAQQGNMKVDLRAISRTIVFLNGDYWGIYSPRERPVDHDYTSFTYDQGKYDLQYVLTWGRTWAEYGGQKAFDDWAEFREFILQNDMSDPENYQRVKDEMQVLSLIDYIIINLNSVCSDWMNYNTGWWRGTHPDGGHKKWGYILWDNDATFDYYINYSGVPNTNPDAMPCDFEEIGEFMDDFFAGGNTFELDSAFISNCNSILSGSCPYSAGDPLALMVMEEDFSCCWGQWDNECQEQYDIFLAELNDTLTYGQCASILNGSSPYLPTDSIYQVVTSLDNYCCNTNWDASCQATYDLAVSGIDVDPDYEEEVRENFGKHEKIFFKLLDESPEFKQLYYSRQADMANTAWSCETMLSTLDEMVGVIDPEMDRHINRWGGSRNEWERNVRDLRRFIEQRCELLDDGMIDCYEVTGPFDLTLEVFPEGAGDIDLNTIEVKSFPWTGAYFGGMENLIDADPGGDYDFVRWESKTGQTIFPSVNDENASLTLTGSDTLVAIFQLETVATDDLDKDAIALKVFPSPTNGIINIKYQLEEAASVKISLFNSLGESIYSLPTEYKNAAELHSNTIDTEELSIQSGTYFVKVDTGKSSAHHKVIVVR